jgi:hypothetical protein
MVFWSDVDLNSIEFQTGSKDRTRFRYQDGPLKFQIPKGVCTWGVSQYKTFNIDVDHPEFIQWWRSLEAHLCPQEPFKSNLTGNSLRVKIDDSAYIFDSESKQVVPEITEGLFKGSELSCMVYVDSTYFFNATWGLTVRAYQLRFYESNEPVSDAETFSLQKGVCSFLL